MLNASYKILRKLNRCTILKNTLFIQTQETPNPNSLKFLPGCQVLASGTYEFKSLDSAKISPLAKSLLKVEGVKSIFLATDFITVNKSDENEWQLLKPEIYSIIMDFFSSGLSVIENIKDNEPQKIVEEDSETVQMIKEILDSRIRPTVQEDGGDVIFIGYSDGVVKLKMQGACTGCPSSVVTLKHGIENMLKFYVPDIKSVEQIEDETETISQKEFEKFEKK
ncbi:unnamed protein product [Gordionus sp. m RMFG-2023]|uniref:NFU1 iron-sulfur cluster scaffold homolog, mitochondrial-like n=1 Tax=Gordionus sp. m RMFG-2023 TaxID=3053472 RepID=UPI0030E564E0